MKTDNINPEYITPDAKTYVVMPISRILTDSNEDPTDTAGMSAEQMNTVGGNW